MYCNSLSPEIKNLYTLVKINKTSKYSKGKSAFSQTCQDDINLSEFVTETEKSDDSLDSRVNPSGTGTQVSDHQGINREFYQGLRLESLLVSKNYINLSRRNLSLPENS